MFPLESRSALPGPARPSGPGPVCSLAALFVQAAAEDASFVHAPVHLYTSATYVTASLQGVGRAESSLWGAPARCWRHFQSPDGGLRGAVMVLVTPARSVVEGPIARAAAAPQICVCADTCAPSIPRIKRNQQDQNSSMISHVNTHRRFVGGRLVMSDFL